MFFHLFSNLTANGVSPVTNLRYFTINSKRQDIKVSDLPNRGFTLLIQLSLNRSITFATKTQPIMHTFDTVAIVKSIDEYAPGQTFEQLVVSSLQPFLG